MFWIDGGPPAGGVEGVAGDEHNDEKEEKEEEACSPGDDGPSPGVEAGRPAETPALPNVEVEDWKYVKDEEPEALPTLMPDP